MTYSGSTIVLHALREIGIVDPAEQAHPELIADGIVVASDLLDSWRTEGLTISGMTRSPYNLVANQQSYTIGSGGDFAQDYPSEIRRWSTVPDDDATHPVEQPRGRPLTEEEWQQIRVKSTTGAYPTKMWFDRRYAAGLGRCLFWPIPDNNDVDIVLYQLVPSITSLAANTNYDLEPGKALALKLALARELAESGRYQVDQDVMVRVVRRASRAIGALKRAHTRPRVAPIRVEFAIERGSRRTFNINTGG